MANHLGAIGKIVGKPIAMEQLIVMKIQTEMRLELL